jgi:hypothetical protein
VQPERLLVIGNRRACRQTRQPGRPVPSRIMLRCRKASTATGTVFGAVLAVLVAQHVGKNTETRRVLAERRRTGSPSGAHTFSKTAVSVMGRSRSHCMVRLIVGRGTSFSRRRSK